MSNTILLTFVNPLRAGHEVPKYTKSRTTRNPEVHEVDCVAEFQRDSLKTMTNALIHRSPGSADNRHRYGVDSPGDFHGVHKRYLLPPTAARSTKVADVADGNPSATDPLHPNSNEINDMSGVAE